MVRVDLKSWAVVLIAAVTTGAAACGGGDAKTAVRALRAQPSSPVEPALAERFDTAPAGLAARFRPEAGPATARLVFPKEATAPLHIEDAGSHAAVDVTLKGARAAKAEPADGYVVYQRAHASGATLVHRPLPDGTEDFLSFDRRPDASEVSYEITPASGVSGLRLVANTLEMLDAAGAPRLRIAPPYIVGADGVRTDALLAVEGCAVDRDPAAPWGRAVTAMGAGTCTVRVSWPSAGVAYPAVLDPRWTTTGSMITPRQEHTALLLSNGKTLVAGGRSTSTGTAGLASAELYDRTTGTWAATGNMTGGRRLHSMTQLNTSTNPTTSGKVLVAGGIDGTTSLTTAQLYSPSAGTWVAAAALNAARHLHTETLLPDGRVLVLGGMNGTTTLQSAALYNPTSNAWAATTGPIPPPGWRFGTATLIQTSNAQLNNRVLMVGGNNGTTSLSSVFLFDPSQNAFSTLASISSPREQHRAVVLPSTNGKILVMGGKNGTTTLATALIFDPAVSNGTWSSAGTMTSARFGHSATVLPTAIKANGSVLVAGGNNGSASLSSAELFSGTSTWTATTALPAPASQGHTATVLGNSMVLLAGGLNGTTVLADARLYDAGFGLACTSNSQCPSGFCASGVCCDSACNGACGSCNLPGFVGTCRPLAGGAVCRAAAGACDVAETCDGTSIACPADSFASAATVCRASAGACDVAESCTGTSVTCPANQFVASGTTCRASTGVCDVAEACTGTGAACPSDVLVAAGTPCRAAQGICDAVERCTGASGSCPADVLAAGATCRPSNGACDPAETCDGSSLACPSDVSTCNAQPQTVQIGLTLPGTLQPRQVVLATSNALQLQANVTLTAAGRPVVAGMGSAGAVIGAGTSNQDLYSVGNVKLDGAHVTGRVLGEGAVQLLNGATVAGGVTSGPIGRHTLTVMSLTFPAKDGGSLDVAQNTTVNLLQTGAYRDVIVRTGATLKLSGGTYTFNSLVTEPGATIAVDDTVSPVEIGVLSTFTHRGAFVAASGSAARTLIVYVGTNDVLAESALAASVIAPNALLTLGSPTGPVTDHGSYFARDIVVRQGTTIVHVPCESIEVPLIGVAVPPTGIEPIPGYDPGSLSCTAGLILGAQATDANGVVYHQDITYPTDTVPTTGPGCRVAMQFCDDNEQVIPSPAEGDLNATVSGACPAVGGPSALCGIDPATTGGPCTTDADCPGAICAAQCTTAACTHTERRCGNYYASCGGIPAEPANCDPTVFRQCADPKAVGTATAADAAAQVQQVTEAPAEILLPDDEKQIPLPYVTLQSGYCAAPAVQPPSDLRQDKGDGTNMGNDQWGFFLEPELSSLFSVSWKEIKEQNIQVGARVGAAAGAKVFGEKITALKATLDFDLEACGSAIGIDLRLFGDSIASLDTVDGLKTGLGPLSDYGNTKKTNDADNQDCLSKFKDRDKKSEDLKKLVYSARNAKEFYLDKGTSKDLCTRTNSELGLAFDCDNPDLVSSVDVPNAWIDEYNKAGRDYTNTKKTFEHSRDKVSGSAQIGLFDKRHTYHMNIFKTTFPIGPITVTIVVDGYGEWRFDGAIQLGLIYGAGLLQLAGEALLPQFAPLFGDKADIKAVGGPIITPGASVGVVVFAGAGIPGVSIGLEGALELLGVAVPLDARLAAARVSEPDTRDLNASEFAGEPFEGMDPTTTQHWKYGWAAGSRLVIEGLNGQLDGVVRVRLLFVSKTFRRNITKWKGFKTVIPLLAASGGIGEGDDPIVATDDFGVYADRIAHTNVVPLGTDALIGNPDPNAHYPDVLGQEPCIIIE